MSEVDAEAIRTGERSRIYQNIHDDVGSDLLKLIYNTQDPDQREAIKNIMSRLPGSGQDRTPASEPG